MDFCNRPYVEDFFRGKRVAVVGSGPGSLDNEPGYVDSFDLVVRVNNWKCTEETGFRTDVAYSFWGGSIKKTKAEMQAEGVNLVLCKCPDSKFITSEWHEKMGKQLGTDFRYIYKTRQRFWFCPTYVPTTEEFLDSFNLLGQHIPSTGFSALLLVKSCHPKEILATGFDFFASRIHNVNEPWRPGNPEDPIGHAPERERDWLKANLDGITVDKRLREILEG